MRLPSSCWIQRRNIINITACIGSTVRIMNALTPAPINAPTIGIKAVTPTKVPAIAAYGRRSIVIPTKHSMPSKSASMNWPTKKLRNVSLAMWKIWLTFLYFSLLKVTAHTLLVSRKSLSLRMSTYIANTIPRPISVTVEVSVPITPIADESRPATPVVRIEVALPAIDAQSNSIVLICCCISGYSFSLSTASF